MLNEDPYDQLPYVKCRPFFSSLALICLNLGKVFTNNYILDADLDFLTLICMFLKENLLVSK